MTEQLFTMSMYPSREEMYKAKAEYYEKKYRALLNIIVDIVAAEYHGVDGDGPFIFTPTKAD